MKVLPAYTSKLVTESLNVGSQALRSFVLSLEYQARTFVYCGHSEEHALLDFPMRDHSLTQSSIDKNRGNMSPRPLSEWCRSKRIPSLRFNITTITPTQGGEIEMQRLWHKEALNLFFTKLTTNALGCSLKQIGYIDYKLSRSAIL